MLVTISVDFILPLYTPTDTGPSILTLSLWPVSLPLPLPLPLPLSLTTERLGERKLGSGFNVLREFDLQKQNLASTYEFQQPLMIPSAAVRGLGFRV